MTGAALAAAALLLWPVTGLVRSAWARAASTLLASLLLAAWGIAGGSIVIGPVPPLPALSFEPTGGSALWLGLMGVLGAVAALAGVDEPPPAAGGRRSALLPLVHLLVLAAAAVVTAATPFALLIGWEALSGLTFVLYLASRPTRRTAAAAWLLLLFSEGGVAAVYLVLLERAAGAPFLPAVAASGLAFLAALGFGAKAALFPLQAWVPVAEPEAPGPVAGLMSGLLTAVALAALWRTLAWLGPPTPAVGVGVLVLGLAGAAVGAFGAMVDRDLKRILAHGTVETLGIAFVGIGASELLRSVGAAGPAAAATTGAVLLVVAHAGAKLTLFLAAGWTEELRLSRRIDRLGGLLKAMPHLGAAALVGALALGGLPPLGAFAAEWLVVESLLMPVPRAPGLHATLGGVGVVLAVLVAVALTAYLRWFGIAFLGPPRRPTRATPRDPALPLRAAAYLALLPAVAAGVGSPWLVPWIQSRYAPGPALLPPLFTDPGLNRTLVGVGAAVGQGLPGARGVVFAPDGAFSILSPWDLLWAAALLAAVTWGVARLCAAGLRRPGRRTRPWAGGDPAYTPAMAFTAEGLTHPLRLAFAGAYGLGRRRKAGPSATRHEVTYAARLERYLYRPARRLLAGAVRASRAVQTGHVATYVAYVLAALLIALMAATLQP
jgi:hydrogenase-4 component B